MEIHKLFFWNKLVHFYCWFLRGSKPFWGNLNHFLSPICSLGLTAKLSCYPRLDFIPKMSLMHSQKWMSASSQLHLRSLAFFFYKVLHQRQDSAHNKPHIFCCCCFFFSKWIQRQCNEPDCHPGKQSILCSQTTNSRTFLPEPIPCSSLTGETWKVGSFQSTMSWMTCTTDWSSAPLSIPLPLQSIAAVTAWGAGRDATNKKNSYTHKTSVFFVDPLVLVYCCSLFCLKQRR